MYILNRYFNNRIQIQLIYYQAILDSIIFITYIADKESLQLSMEKQISPLKEEIDQLNVILYRKEGIN